MTWGCSQALVGRWKLRFSLWVQVLNFGSSFRLLQIFQGSRDGRDMGNDPLPKAMSKFAVAILSKIPVMKAG